ncbi:hypothetical protein QE152_g34102 [Popillia japonica]|uniref:Uncharacterized protein n=1 Tax=Popillia japonica TaxID=7064 RepID=A0AAW1IU29_POPJA
MLTWKVYTYTADKCTYYGKIFILPPVSVITPNGPQTRFSSQILLAEKDIQSLPKRKLSYGKHQKLRPLETRQHLWNNVKIPVFGLGTWFSCTIIHTYAMAENSNVCVTLTNGVEVPALGYGTWQVVSNNVMWYRKDHSLIAR